MGDTKSSRRWLPALPLAAWMIATLLSWPAHLWLVDFLSHDPGDSLAATLLANLGQRVNIDFSYPYGPLTLLLQQVATWLVHPPVLAFALLEAAAALAMALAAAWAIRQLRLGILAAVLLTLCAFMLSNWGWPPVYQLEAATLAWSLLLLATGRRGAALAVCVLAVLCKPSMGYVIGLLELLEALLPPRLGRQRLKSTLFPPLATGVVALAVLSLHFGPRSVFTMVWPGLGMKGYALMGVSFFKRSGNPLWMGSNWHFLLGTPVLSWMLASLLVLAVSFAAVRAWPRYSPPQAVAAIAGVATVLFVVAFYGPPPSFVYYYALPLIGLAMLAPRPHLQRALVVIAILAVCGNFTAVRDHWRQWRTAHPQADDAGLWATPAQAAEWSQLRARAAAGQVVFASSGSPEASVPGAGPLWHGDMVIGIATPRELAEFDRRVGTATCLAALPGWRLSDSTADAVLARAETMQPHSHGEIFDTYGCR